MKYIVYILFYFSILSLSAQEVPYIYPTEPLVKQKLNQWQDKKFGMIIHWGLYSVAGIVESWNLCAEDESWIPRDSTANYERYKQWYFGLQNQFSPKQFDPESWAKMAKNAGMKYLIFTTKHHDGFALFNTQYSPFKSSVDYVKPVFDAFRKEHLWVGAYFSKPDWHSEYYWWPRYATPNRQVNYNPEKHPERWKKFKGFVHNQLNEITSNYGPLDLLWLDGGWVRPKTEPNPCNVAEKWNQDIDMQTLVPQIRKAQPDIIVVDRDVHGINENYRTPERTIPETALNYPWESCIPLGNDWGYVPNDSYKSAEKIIHTLVEIVAKGGNFLLGIGPKPDGTFPEIVQLRLQEIGQWTTANQDALYNTRPLQPFYQQPNTWFTQNGNTIYAFYSTEDNKAPTQIVLDQFPKTIQSIRLLENQKQIKFSKKNNQIFINIPQTEIKHNILVLKINTQ